MEKKRKLKRTLKKLRDIKGSNTELVSIYIPAEYDLNLIRNMISEEKSTAKNIKSKRVRKNVGTALSKIEQELKLYKKTPENGMAIFCGNVSEREGKPEFEIWVLEPPYPLEVKTYKCDKEFLLEPLEKMLEARNVYGLIVLDNKEVTIGLLKGTSVKVRENMDSIVPGKTRKGGQSADRFSRVREGLKKDWYKKIGSKAKRTFESQENIKGILVGGPGPAKDAFLSGDYLPTKYQEKVLAKIDVGYSNEHGLEKLIDKGEDVLEKEEIIKEKKEVKKFLEGLSKSGKRVAYGEEEVWNYLKEGRADEILLSEDLSDEKIDKFEEAAENFGTETEIISTETSEGNQLKELGGFAAFLRY